jgi:hypothetical protein
MPAEYCYHKNMAIPAVTVKSCNAGPISSKNISTEFARLAEDNQRVCREIGYFLRYSPEVNLHLLRLGIRAAEHYIDLSLVQMSRYGSNPLARLFEGGINPLLMENPGLAEEKNIKVLELLVELGIKAVENEFNPMDLFELGINPLLEQNPSLAEAENIDSLRQFGTLLVELGIKAVENEFDPRRLFKDAIDPLLKQNPDLAEVKNIKFLELLVKLGIKAAENKFSPIDLFELGINPLLEQNPSLVGMENVNSLRQFVTLFVELGIKTVENQLYPAAFFYNGIKPLLKQNPDLAEVKNIKFLELLVELGIKAAENRFDPGDSIIYIINSLLKQNPGLAEVKNIKFLELLVKLGIKAAENKVDPWHFFDLGLQPLLQQNPSMVEGENIDDFKRLGNSLLNICLNTSKHNRERVFTLLCEQYKKFTLSQLEHYLSFVNKVLSTYPCLGYPLLEGIFDAVDESILPKDLNRDIEASVLHFIARMNSFEPILYKVFSQQGDKFIDEVLDISNVILTDGFGQKDLEAIKQKYPHLDGDQLILAIIQTRIPLSGASFVSRSESLGLFKKMAECGDLRSHVPPYWGAHEIIRKLTSSEMRVREGEEIDTDGKIKAIIELMRSSDRPKKQEVILALKEYLKGDLDNKERKQKFMEVFLKYAGAGDLLGEKVDRLGDKDFYTLRILEEIFKDKDNLTTLLAGMFEEIEKDDPGSLAREVNKQLLVDPQGLAKVLKKNLPNLPSEERKVEAAAKILSRYTEEEIRQRLLPLLSGSPDLVNIIEAGLKKEYKTVLSKKAVIEKLLADPLAYIRHEMSKFMQVEKDEAMELGFRVVKGIPYGLWGLNAGVCVATDIELWKNPEFKLIAIEDKKTQTIAGFIHVFETTIGGKKILTIPGIEPSVEFMNNVDPMQLYDQIEAALKEFAKLGGYDVVYVPTKALIHSNRTDIQKAIQKKKYPAIKLDQPVNWNHTPSPYPFDEVYVIKV